jgi:RNA polymerase sigma-70 factor (ECF subfamily)
MEDLELITALQTGNESALTDIMQRHREPLYRFIFRYVNDTAEAQDILQETFVRVYFQCHRYQPRASFKTWLYQIALNLCRDYARRNRWRRLWTRILPGNEAETSTYNEGNLTNIATSSSTPNELAITADDLIQALETIKSLPHDLKSALILHVLEGYSQKDCAEILGCTSKAIETRISRSRKILKQKLST